MINILIIMLLQIFILNNVLLFNSFHPYLYVLIILLLPSGTNKTIVMLAGFVTGFIIDIFNYTYGLHAIATTTMAFLRPFILSFLFESEEENRALPINSKLLGYREYITFIVTMIFIHHLLLFFVEAGGLQHFQRTFYILIFSTTFSSLLVLIYDLFMQFRKP